MEKRVASAFDDIGCAFCKGECCCALARDAVTCNNKVHCYVKCPGQKAARSSASSSSAQDGQSDAAAHINAHSPLAIKMGASREHLPSTRSRPQKRRPADAGAAAGAAAALSPTRSPFVASRLQQGFDALMDGLIRGAAAGTVNLLQSDEAATRVATRDDTPGEVVRAGAALVSMASDHESLADAVVVETARPAAVECPAASVQVPATSTPACAARLNPRLTR